MGGRAQVTVFDPLVDSAAIGAEDWNRMLDLIEAVDDPVVITHGTDTMAYTGAALSRALAGRAATVLLCGSMAPSKQIDKARMHDVVPENDRLLRALGSMGRIMQADGKVQFRNDAHAGRFADAQRQRYGKGAVVELAIRQTDALA